MKTSAENTTERRPERPPNDPPNDPWFMSCQAQDPGPSLTTTWSAELPAPPHPFFIPNHQIKKTNVPPIQKRYVRGMTKGTFPPCKLHVKYAGRRITIAQPLSSIIRDLIKSSRSIAHSDDFEGHKLIQTNSRQLFLLDLKILFWCPASRDHIKPLLVQPQISCNANGLAVANPIGRAMI